jgi:hypothetical protein
MHVQENMDTVENWKSRHRIWFVQLSQTPQDVWKEQTEHDVCDSYSTHNFSSRGFFALVNAQSVILEKHAETFAGFHVK